MAVTVAPATGSLAELITIPTIVPDAVLTTGAEDSSAWTACNASPIVNTDIRKPFRQFRNFIALTPSLI
jgi:hypothetical protein